MKKKKTRSDAMPDGAAIVSILQRHNRPARPEAILELAGLRAQDRKKLERILRELAGADRVERLPGGFWGLPEKSVCVSGEFNGQTNGGGRVRVTEPAGYPQKEIFISPFQTGGAWHKDIVRALILPHTGGAKGRILEIVERRQKEIPAIYARRYKKTLRFQAADGRLAVPLLVPAGSPHTQELAEGMLAVLRPVRETENGFWQAEIVSVLGPADRIRAQENIVKLSQQVPLEFPQLALEQAQALPAAPAESDLEGREDWRALPFVTIDGADARDFDDAIHVEQTPDGWILRVAIADVAHYVRPDDEAGSLDAEAMTRGNSWYFPRSVEPMLPQALSNGLCSLKPDADRLAMLVEMPFDKNGEPQTPRFAEIVMRSRARLTYDEVGAFFTGEKNDLPAGSGPMLADAHDLYKILAQKRRARGTLDFFLPEPVYEFDENGALVKMGESRRNDAHMLIEEFMIAANEAVAKHLGALRQDFLYRVHPQPEPEKLTRLYETLALIAPEVLPPEHETPPDSGSIRQILAAAAGTAKEYVVNRLCLRSMGQARYQPENIGHFGLASEAYCHFTSPIRRYADLLTHRALKESMGQRDEQLPDRDKLKEIGDQLNGLERRAVECEREIAKRLACIFLEGREGEVFDGTISGVTDFGLFVEFGDFPAEGLMRIEDMARDWYRFDQQGQCLIGMHSGHVWRLGQPVRVRLLDVNVEKQEIRLAPAQKQAVKLPREERRTAKPVGKERRSERDKPARSARWTRKNAPDRKDRRKR